MMLRITTVGVAAALAVALLYSCCALAQRVSLRSAVPDSPATAFGSGGRDLELGENR